MLSFCTVVFWAGWGFGKSDRKRLENAFSVCDRYTRCFEVILFLLRRVGLHRLDVLRTRVLQGVVYLLSSPRGFHSGSLFKVLRRVRTRIHRKFLRLAWFVVCSEFTPLSELCAFVAPQYRQRERVTLIGRRYMLEHFTHNRWLVVTCIGHWLVSTVWWHIGLGQ